MIRRLALPSLLLTGCVHHDPRPSDAVIPAGTTVLAHRGYSSRAPENTLAAFQAAADAGFGFELDVGLSADGVPILLHDDTLDRTTDGSGPLDGRTAADLGTLDAGAWFDARFSGQRLPTLREVLSRWGGVVPIDVEIKTPRDGGPWTADGLGRRVASLIEELGLVDAVFVTSFSPYVLEAVRAEVPGIRRGQLFGDFEGSDLWWHEKLALRNLWLNGRADADLLAVQHDLLTPAYVEGMRARGYRLAAWTVNEPARAVALAEMGVSVLISDVPEDVARAVAERADGSP